MYVEKNTGCLYTVYHKLAIAINILLDCIMGVYFAQEVRGSFCMLASVRTCIIRCEKLSDSVKMSDDRYSKFMR